MKRTYQILSVALIAMFAFMGGACSSSDINDPDDWSIWYYDQHFGHSDKHAQVRTEVQVNESGFETFYGGNLDGQMFSEMVKGVPHLFDKHNVLDQAGLTSYDEIYQLVVYVSRNVPGEEKREVQVSVFTNRLIYQAGSAKGEVERYHLVSFYDKFFQGIDEIESRGLLGAVDISRNIDGISEFKVLVKK